TAVPLPLPPGRLAAGPPLSAASAPLTFVEAEFRRAGDADGQSVVVRRALVDTGSSDCELREAMFRKIQPLPVIQEGVVYETATGVEAFDVFEVQISVQGRSCVAAMTVVPEARFAPGAEDPCTDDAIIGHMALAALGLLVDPKTRRLIPRDLLRDGDTDGCETSGRCAR
ncbi:unnamed protein product, partial [Symbiodinium sp. KB8]